MFSFNTSSVRGLSDHDLCAKHIGTSSQMISTNLVAGIRVSGTDDFSEVKRRVKSWRNYLENRVPTLFEELRARKRSQFQFSNSSNFDVIILGFGAAGSAAALDAADNGLKVLLVDRFDGGGSTRRSGGVYYAGGGTRAQIECGIKDSVKDMFKYVKAENAAAVDDVTILEFCEQSPSTFAWLEDRVGVKFVNADGKRKLFSSKTSYPPNDATLYASGNESAAPWKDLAQPAPRGHRCSGEYLTGSHFFKAFQESVESHPNITILLHAKGEEVLRFGSKCVGVKLRVLPQDDEWADLRAMQTMLHEIGSGSPYFDPKREIDTLCAKYDARLFKEFGKTVTLDVENVILACGGFYFNQDMVEIYAQPAQHGLMPLGQIGDDGSAMQMASRIGAKLDRMDRISCWKFTNPPESFVHGILVDSSGKRVRNEDLYGATLADVLVRENNGKGWLIIDQETWDLAREECMDQSNGLQEDQRMQGLANLFKNCVKAENLQNLAENTGIESTLLRETLTKYNTGARNGVDNEFRKNNRYLKPLKESEGLYAIRMDMKGSKYWPTPAMTLGGIRVQGDSGLVLDNDTETPIEGLYAAGRSAVGIASNSYVSGLSLACSVFSGRRAGMHVATWRSRILPKQAAL